MLIKSQGFDIFKIGWRQNPSNTFLYHTLKNEANLRTSIKQLSMHFGRGLLAVTHIKKKKRSRKIN
jgi:hypothetical protein